MWIKVTIHAPNDEQDGKVVRINSDHIVFYGSDLDSLARTAFYFVFDGRGRIAKEPVSFFDKLLIGD